MTYEWAYTQEYPSKNHKKLAKLYKKYKNGETTEGK